MLTRQACFRSASVSLGGGRGEGVNALSAGKAFRRQGVSLRRLHCQVSEGELVFLLVNSLPLINTGDLPVLPHPMLRCPRPVPGAYRRRAGRTAAGAHTFAPHFTPHRWPPAPGRAAPWRVAAPIGVGVEAVAAGTAHRRGDGGGGWGSGFRVVYVQGVCVGPGAGLCGVCLRGMLLLLGWRLSLLAQRTSAASTPQVHVAAQRWQAALETANAYHLDCDAVYRQV